MQISQQQLTELKALFDYFDKDGSGELDMEQLEQLIFMLMGQKPTQQQKLDLLAQVDQDGNGNIQYAQFESLFKRKLMNSNFRKQMKMAFQLIDIGETGYIDFHQLQRICNQLNMGFSKQDIEKMIEKGSDGTGKVYLEKFIQMMKD